MDIEDIKERRDDLQETIRRLLENFRSETGARPDVVVDWQDYNTVGGTKVFVPPMVQIRLTL